MGGSLVICTEWSVTLISQISYNIVKSKIHQIQCEIHQTSNGHTHKSNGQIHQWIYKPRTLILGSDRCLVLISWVLKVDYRKHFLTKIIGKLYVLKLSIPIYSFFHSPLPCILSSPPLIGSIWPPHPDPSIRHAWLYQIVLTHKTTNTDTHNEFTNSCSHRYTQQSIN